jgi:sugar lactone lactonase YvrE
MSNPFSIAEKVNAIIRVRRGRENERILNIYESGELVYSTDKKRLFVGDSNDLGATGTFGGNVAGNKIWITDNFSKLSEIVKNDLVYRTDLASTNGTGFYLLTGDNHLRIDNYILIQNAKDLPLAYVLPEATTSRLGGIIVKDGLKVTNGFVQVDVDDSTIKIDPLTKKIYVPNTGGGGTINTNSPATENTLGVVKVPLDGGIKVSNGEITLNVDNKTVKLSSTGTGSVLYVEPTQLKIPTANYSTTGVIRVGNGLSASNAGVLNLNVASDSNLGGLMLGDGLTYNLTTGKVDVTKISPIANNLSAGIVKTSEFSVISADIEGTLNVLIDNNTIKIDSTGLNPVLYVDREAVENQSTSTTDVDNTVINITNSTDNTLEEIVNTTTDTSISINDILNKSIVTTSESSYIKRVANVINSGGAYAAITKDNRVIAWGVLWRNIFGGITDPPVLAVENVRVPFWKNYDGYTDALNYKPYGGDFLDEASNEKINYEITDLYWSKFSAMALVKLVGEKGGDVWVAGTNTAGAAAAAGNPKSLVKTKYNNFLIANETATQGITLLNKDKDYGIITKTPSTAPRDIIEDKTNLSAISAQSFYYYSDGTTVKRINYNGELISSPIAPPAPNAFVAPNGLAMTVNDNGTNNLYVCDVGTNQNKIRIVNLNTNAVTNIGAGAAGTTDGDQTTAKFTTLKRIAVDPSNNNILYVTDNHRIRRLWRTITGGTASWNVTTISLSTGPSTSIDGTLTYGGSGTNVASFNNPYGIKVSSDGKRIYVIEQGAKKIRKIDVHTNTVDSFSGTSSTYIDGTVKNLAAFNIPKGITKDDQGNLYIADYANARIRKINYDISTGTYGDVITFAGNGTKTWKDAVGTSASFNNPTDVVYVSAMSALYVTDTANNRIRKIDINTKNVTTIAGTGAATSINGNGLSATFNNPHSIEYGFKNGEHCLWVTTADHRIREIKITNLSANVSTIAGTGVAGNIGDGGSALSARLNTPTDMVYYNNELYFSDTLNNKIRKIKFSNNTIRAVAGTGVAGSSNGNNGATATFNYPIGLVVKNDMLYVADHKAHKIRRIQHFTDDNQTIVKCYNFAGTGVAGSKNAFGLTSQFNLPAYLTIDYNGNFIVSDQTNHRIRKINKDDPNIVSLINGTGKPAFADTGFTTLTWDPFGIDIDSEDGNDIIYFSEIINDTIGQIVDGKVILYPKLVAGGLGIGVGTGKATCGFIKVNAYDTVNDTVPKFKRIQMLGNTATTLLFAALDTEDSLWVWGNSPDGAFGTGQINTIAPTKLYAFDKNVLDFSITASTTNISLFSIITKDNKMYVAGDNTNGQLGYGLLYAALNNSTILKIAKKNISGTSVDVDDAKKLVSSSIIGKRNNLYINLSGDVYACGDHTQGILGRGTLTSIEPYFYKVDNLSNIKHVLVGGNIDFPTAMALKSDGGVYGWGYNGGVKGQCLVNENTLTNITNPLICYNYEIQAPVNNAIYIYGNDNPSKDQAQFAYLDSNSNLYLGGFSTETDVPDFSATNPYYRKYNMKNIALDVNISGGDTIIHRTNGTVYIINRYGPKKLF